MAQPSDFFIIVKKISTISDVMQSYKSVKKFLTVIMYLQSCKDVQYIETAKT